MEKKQVNFVRVFGLFLIISLVYACVGKDEAKLRVTIKGLEKKQAVVQEQRINGIKILDTLEFNSHGRLKYQFELRQPTFYNLVIPEGTDLFFLIFPQDKIQVTANSEGEIENLKIEGSEESMKLNILYDSLFKTRDALKGIRNAYSSASDTSDRNSLARKYETELDKYRRFSMQFVLDNLHSLVSIAALYQEAGPDEFVFGRKRDLQFFKLVTDSLTKYYPKHRHVIALKRNFETMIETVQLERLMNSVGSVKTGLPDLELPSLKGDIKTLSASKGKYILLNFYTHSDQSNAQFFKQLRATYDKYSAKGFNIYNVYLGKSPDTWKKIVNFEEIGNWINVADTAFPYSHTRVAYNITAIPSNYLIDMKDQSILKKDISPQDLGRVLNELLK